MLIDLIASDKVIDAAYQWVCEKRAHHHFNSDVWQVRRRWSEKKPLRKTQGLPKNKLAKKSSKNNFIEQRIIMFIEGEKGVAPFLSQNRVR